MATLYPSGYAGAMRTMEQTAALTTVQRLHPEVWRRMSALMVEAAGNGVQLGVGTGWRRQPTDGRPGFAAPGNSYHEGFMPGGTTRPDGVNDRNAMAIDTVLPDAWPWMNGNAGRFGFVHFANVNNEPWHIQPVEIPRSRNFATAQPPLRTWPLQEGDDEMTEDDQTWILTVGADAIAKKVWERVLPALGALGPGAAHAVLQEARLGNRAFPAINKAIIDDGDHTRAALDPATLLPAITEAVLTALEDVTVNADVSTDDIAKIALACAHATVAEIAS